MEEYKELFDLKKLNKENKDIDNTVKIILYKFHPDPGIIVETEALVQFHGYKESHYNKETGKWSKVKYHYSEDNMYARPLGYSARKKPKISLYEGDVLCLNCTNYNLWLFERDFKRAKKLFIYELEDQIKDIKRFQQSNVQHSIELRKNRIKSIKEQKSPAKFCLGDHRGGCRYEFY